MRYKKNQIKKIAKKKEQKKPNEKTNRKKKQRKKEDRQKKIKMKLEINSNTRMIYQNLGKNIFNFYNSGETINLYNHLALLPI
jgi:glutamate synthase domain-containing protein 3